MARTTYRVKTLELATVKLALSLGYEPYSLNETALRHFHFFHKDKPQARVDVSWYAGSDYASVTVGDTTTNDAHAYTMLVDCWGKKAALAAAQE